LAPLWAFFRSRPPHTRDSLRPEAAPPFSLSLRETAGVRGRSAPVSTRIQEQFCSRHFFPNSSALLLAKGLNRSIGTGRKVVVLCSLEISRMV